MKYIHKVEVIDGAIVATLQRTSDLAQKRFVIRTHSNAFAVESYLSSLTDVQIDQWFK